MAGFFGIGTDLVEVERITRSIERPRFVEEVFGPRERAYCAKRARPGQHYAARFAAKEAFLKALGIGLFSGVALGDIEVVNEDGGQPHLVLGPSAQRALSSKAGAGAAETFVTLSHIKSLASATVVVRA
ncbi:MAG: holo-ACP synthase [Myxococcales bacterium]|jgi:holo-[acyl-carrier protein] synthase|nr:holo-ACP synthase [Myxococcales bacterium]